MLKKIFLLLILVWTIGGMTARQQKESKTDALNAISQKRWQDAEQILWRLYNQFKISGNRDSLYGLLYAYGEFGLARAGAKAAEDSISQYISRARTYDSSASFIRQLWLDAAEFYSDIGQSNMGFDAAGRAMEVTLAEQSPDPLVIAQIHYNLGVYAQRMGQVQVSIDNHRKAMFLRKDNPKVEAEDLYMSYNAIGANHWFASRYDSSAIYFQQSLEQIDRMPKDLINTHYRRSIVLNNLAGLYGQLGRLTEAIAAQEQSVRLTREFISDPAPHAKKTTAEAGIYQGIDNLGGLFKQIGDFRRAGDLLQYSYAKKKETLKEGHIDICISEVLLGQYYTDIQEHQTAIRFLSRALSQLEQSGGEYLFWEADACRSMARSLNALGNSKQASEYYNRAALLFEESYQGEYDNAYLDFLRDASLFWAAHGQLDRALDATNKTYKYVAQVQGANSLGAFNQLLNLSEVYSEAGSYDRSLQYATEGIQVLRQQVKQADNKLDSIRMQMYLPLAVYMQEKAKYSMATAKDSAFLAGISKQLSEAIRLLEERKVFLDDSESINVLMSENTSLFEFARQIEMELYQLTGRAAFLDRFINLHESSIYGRIRSRLDKADAARFANLPDSIVAQERQLKQRLAASLKATEQDGFEKYVRASDQWNKHLDKIRIQYPDYYQMRYAQFAQNGASIDSILQTDETLLRYYEVAGKWYVLVISPGQRHLLPLPAEQLAERIEHLYQYNQQDSVPAHLLYSLYRDLWEPAAPYIKTGKVLIVPDGILFSLSFDMLTSREIQRYSELSQYGLIAQHAISYQYSLYLVHRNRPTQLSPSNFIAFVPGFDQKAKDRYRKQQPDSLLMDNQYLKLLAQPNTLKMAERLVGSLGGQAYTDEASTVDAFKRTATGHRLVLIGTHAEYDNVNPDRSRLIFAKDRNGSDSNALYLEDIYGCQVQSDLTILTACESGKPGFRDGEGMVSLAHAFNYAGSRNILMGLWKIDEKSSSLITEKMVIYLHQGLGTAEALRKAKLDYLASAPGRTLAPVYWAGLVLMGDAAAIEFEEQSGLATGWWIAIAVILILIILSFVVKNKRISGTLA